MNEEKFTGKAELYDKYRPSYPDSLIDWLYGKAKADTAADMGAGTGIFTLCLSKKPWKLTAVEPNPDMCGVLRKNAPFAEVINASAENTGIESGSVGLVTAAQAFHWFDEEGYKAECKRILKPGGRVAVVYNDRTELGISLERDRICQKYCEAARMEQSGRKAREEVDRFLKDQYFSDVEIFAADNDIEMDEEALVGDTLSRSYALKEVDEGFSRFVGELKDLFSKYEQNGFVTVKYTSTCYLGKF